jgi:RNA polymerase sigma-B factor
MQTTALTPPPDRGYADVPELMRQLEELDVDSAEYRRQRERIINRCLPLADHIARRFENKGEPRDDLVQVARLGLVNAVNRYDAGAGTHFLSFAVPTVMGEVRRHFRDNGWAVHTPRRLKELHLQLGAAAAELTQRLGRAPTATELAAELGLEREEVVEGMIAGNSYSAVSMDAGPTGADDDLPPLAAKLGSEDPNLATIENREALSALVNQLPERLRAVLIMRFFESLTQSEIAERIGVSQMQVSRLLAQALARLRSGME